MNKNAIWTVVVVVLIIIVGFIVFSAPSTKAAPLKIGVVGPMSGDQATYGEGAKMGIDLAWNDLRGNLPSSIKSSATILYEDSRGDVKGAVSAAQKLIDVDKVGMLISAGPSQEAVALAPVAQKASVPFIAMESQAPELNDAGDYVFRTMADMTGLATKLSEIIQAKGFKKVAILTASYNQATIAAEQTLTASLKAANVPIVFEEQFSKGISDFRGQLAKIKTAGADVIFMNGLVADGITFLKQKQELNVSGQVLSQGSVEEQKLIDQTGAGSNGIIFATYNAFPSQDFVDKIKAKYNEPYRRWNIEGYENIQFIVAALNNAKSFDRVGLRDALSSTKKFKSVTGDTFTFDDKGNIIRTVYLKAIQDGKFVPYQNS